MNILVSNLPTRADRAFLNVLFDGQVVDSVWAGYGAHRYAVVALRDRAYAQLVLDARAAFEALRASDGLVKKVRSGRAIRKGKGAAVAEADGPSTEDAPGMTVNELLMSGEETNTTTANKTPAPTSAATTAPTGTKRSANNNPTAELELSPFYGDVISGDRILYIGPSPLTVSEILATGCTPGSSGSGGGGGRGGAVGEEKWKRKEADVLRTASDQQIHAKRPREESSALGIDYSIDESTVPSAAAPASGGAASTPTASTSARPRAPREKKIKAPQRTALADDSDNDAADVVVVPPAGTAPPAVAPNAREAHNTTKCGPTASDKPTVAAAAAAGSRVVASQLQHRAAPVAPPQPPSFTRTSKDQCKFCGSELHLSRHCPNK